MGKKSADYFKKAIKNATMVAGGQQTMGNSRCKQCLMMEGRPEHKMGSCGTVARCVQFARVARGAVRVKSSVGWARKFVILMIGLPHQTGWGEVLRMPDWLCCTMVEGAC